MYETKLLNISHAAHLNIYNSAMYYNDPDASPYNLLQPLNLFRVVRLQPIG